MPEGLWKEGLSFICSRPEIGGRSSKSNASDLKSSRRKLCSKKVEKLEDSVCCLGSEGYFVKASETQKASFVSLKEVWVYV